MKKYLPFFISIFMLKNSLQAQDEPGPIFISLGYYCGPAELLKQQHLRHAAYPFDWLYSSFANLYKCLDDDFAHFGCELRLNTHKTWAIDSYGLEFVHDFPRAPRDGDYFVIMNEWDDLENLMAQL